ncbi:40071_t:CDS:1, partial [Gigaspora margarita]
MDKSCANNVDNELRIADLNNEATTAKHDNIDGSVLVFDRGK